MNVTVLSQVAQSSRAADVIFRAMAGRERSTWNLNLARFYADLAKTGANVSREEFNKVFGALEKAGAGQVIYGHRGSANRFAWNYSLRQAAERTLREIEAKRSKQTAPIAPVIKQVTAPTIIQIEIPAGVSQSEIQAWISLAKELKIG